MGVYYNTEALLNDADIFEYVKSAGIQYIQKGSNISIKCPNHYKELGKEDSNIGNCVLMKDRKHYHCYACNSNGNVLSLIMHANDCSFPEACANLADFLGNPDLYVEGGKHLSIEELFPFTNEELNTLGLLKMGKTKTVVQSSKIKHSSRLYEVRADFDENLETIYTDMRVENFELKTLLKSNPKAFYKMVFLKAEAKAKDIYNMLKNDSISHYLDDEKMMQEFENTMKKEYEICIQVLMKYSNSSQYNQPLIMHHQKRISRFS